MSKKYIDRKLVKKLSMLLFSPENEIHIYRDIESILSIKLFPFLVSLDWKLVILPNQRMMELIYKVFASITCYTIHSAGEINDTIITLLQKVQKIVQKKKVLELYFMIKFNKLIIFCVTIHSYNI